MTAQPTSPAPNAFIRQLSIVLIVAAAVRIALLIHAHRDPQTFDFPDAQRYVAVARNLRAGQGPIDSPQVRAGTDPLYPLMLAAGPSLGFDSDDALLEFGRIVCSVFGLAGVALLAALARRLFDDATALLAATMLAIDPILLFFNATTLTDVPYCTLMIAAFLALQRLRAGGQTHWAIATGILLGLGALLRSTSLFLPLFLIPVAAYRFPGGRMRAGRQLFVIGAVYAVTLTPVVIRHHRLSGDWHLPTRTGGGASLLEAFGPWADGGPGMDRIVYPPLPADADEWQRDRICRQAAFDWIRRNPGRSIELALVKACRTWGISINAVEQRTAFRQAVAWLTVTPVYACALAGVVLLRRRVELLFLLLAPAVYFTLIHMVFVGSIRYRLPAVPMLFVLASTAVVATLRARRAARGTI